MGEDIGMADRVQPPLTRIQQKNRDLILEGALSVFSVNGFRGATIDQIAEAAGLSKPNVLYYFASKDDVLLAAMDVPFDPREVLARVVEECTQTISREVAEQFSPMFQKAALTMCPATRSKCSASSSTIAGFLPPHSSTTRLRFESAE